MKNKTYIFLYIGVWLMTMGFDLNKTSTQKPIAQFPFSGSYFTADNLGHMYLVNRNNDIIKMNSEGKTSAKVNFKLYGKLESIDASNPFELMAFYREQQTVVILDNMLSVLATLDLSQISAGEVTAVCRSYDNNIWLYDAAQTRLMKYSKTLKKEVESLPFATWSTSTWKPHYMVDNEKHVILLDSIQGTVIFDAFGNYYKQLKGIAKSEIQVDNSSLFFTNEANLIGYDYIRFSSDTSNTKREIKQFKITRNHLYLHTQDSIFVY